MTVVPPRPGGSGSPGEDRPPTTFTREELDAAEPEVPRSAGVRLLVGAGVGFLAFALGWPVSLVSIVAIPFAWTWSGAGVLVGFGAPATVAAAIAWLDPGPGADAGWFIALVLVTGYAVGSLALGVVALAVRALLGRRGRTVDEAEVFRPRRIRSRGR